MENFIFCAVGASRLPQISKIENLARIVYDQNPLTIVTKRSIVDVCGVTRYDSVLCHRTK